MTGKPKLQSVIADAISKADSSYFFEDYTKQAKAVIQAVEKAGFAIIPNDIPDALWEKAANEMRTGRLKPHEHVKDVWVTVLRLLKQ
jgi:hypothetical protein